MTPSLRAKGRAGSNAINSHIKCIMVGTCLSTACHLKICKNDFDEICHWGCTLKVVEHISFRQIFVQFFFIKHKNKIKKGDSCKHKCEPALPNNLSN
jgi:hypothetical protein